MATRSRRLALAQGNAPREGLDRSARLLLSVLALVTVLVLAYVGARETSVFAVRSVEVQGASSAVIGPVRVALGRFVGDSLVTLDVNSVENVLTDLPGVRGASIDRAFPGTLRVTLRLERPVAVLRRGAEAWLVAATGRILRELVVGELPRLPRIWQVVGETELEPGEFLSDLETATAVKALARVPGDFPVRIDTARGTVGDLVLVVPGKTELRLGEARDLRLKLAVARSILRGLPDEDRAGLAYLDLSLPGRAVAMPKSQVVS